MPHPGVEWACGRRRLMLSLQACLFLTQGYHLHSAHQILHFRSDPIEVRPDRLTRLLGMWDWVGIR